MTLVQHLVGTTSIAGASLLSTSACATVFPLKSDDLGLSRRYRTGDHATRANQGMGKDITAVPLPGGAKSADTS